MCTNKTDTYIKVYGAYIQKVCLLLEYQDLNLLQTLTAASWVVNALALSDEHLVMGSDDCRICIYDVKDSGICTYSMVDKHRQWGLVADCRYRCKVAQLSGGSARALSKSRERSDLVPTAGS